MKNMQFNFRGSFYIYCLFLLKAHSNLKEALQLCASFRGCYLDTKDKADVVNEQKLAERKGTRSEYYLECVLMHK